MSALTVVESYTETALANADSFKNEFLNYSRDLENGIINRLRSYVFPTKGELENVAITGVNNEQFSLNSVVDLRNQFDSKYNYLLDVLQRTVPRELNKFINDYFPTPNDFDKIEQFLVDSVMNGGIGLPPEVEKQIWDAERERTLLENNRVILENRKSMASRGFIEPNGVELYREMVIMNQGSKNISGSSRTIAIESAKLRIDWIRSAVAEIRGYRTLAIESAFRYISTLLSTQDPAFRYASGYVDSYKTFYDAVNSYYNSVNTINRLNLEKANLIDNRRLSYFKLQQDRLNFDDNQKVTVMTELAKMMASQAGASLSGINSIVQLGQLQTGQLA